MRTIHIIIVVIALMLIVPSVAFIVADQAQYTNPIRIENGKAIATTVNGDQEFESVEYLSNLVYVKPIAIAFTSSATTPATLPNTSAPHGTYVCVMVDNFGNSFDVAQDSPCE